MSISHKILAGLMVGAVLLTGALMATPAVASEDEQTVKGEAKFLVYRWSFQG